LEETRWPRDLPGQLVLEAGSGSGRFTEHAAATGATVVSFDYSGAVEANFRNNGHLENVLILQASIYQMPFREASFDKVFCIGVLQHTPSPDEAFGCLARVLKAGGNLVVDAYRIRPWYEMIFLTKYWVRPVTRRLPPEKLYRFCETWVRLWWKPTGYFVRLTGRRTLSWFLLIADYRGVYPLPDSIQQEWSILDTFDMLSPAYDYPQTLSSVRAWFEGERFVEIDVCYGFNGIEGRGNKA
jgi:SAM-dependent methyltransferase